MKHNYLVYILVTEKINLHFLEGKGRQGIQVWTCKVFGEGRELCLLERGKKGERELTSKAGCMNLQVREWMHKPAGCWSVGLLGRVLKQCKGGVKQVYEAVRVDRTASTLYS